MFLRERLVMRVKFERLLAASIALSAVSIASAQSDQDAATPAADAPANELAPSPEVAAQRDVKLTPDEMVKEADKHLARMDQQFAQFAVSDRRGFARGAGHNNTRRAIGQMEFEET